MYSALASSPRLRYGTTTEAWVQLRYRTAGVFSHLIAVVTANAATGASSVTFRKNGAAGSSTLTIGAGLTGTFEDTVNTDTIASGDLVALQIVNGTGGSLTIAQVGMVFTATGSTAFRTAAVSSLGFSASVTNYLSLAGDPNNGVAEVAAQMRIPSTMTVSHLSVYVDTNTRADTSTYRSRKNTANGNMTFTVGAGVTGLFEDTTNTDSLVAGDLYCLRLTTGAGAGSLGSYCWSAQFAPSGIDHVWANASSGTVFATGTTRYCNPFGFFALVSATETATQFKARGILGASLSKAAAYVTANASSGTSTITGRKNAADTALVITIGAGVTGLFTDLTNAVAVVDTDLIAWKVVVGATGGLTLSMLTIQATQSPAPPPFAPHPMAHMLVR